MKYTIEELDIAFMRAEQETANHFDGQTCSMVDVNGEDTCPICFFMQRLKINLGANVFEEDAVKVEHYGGDEGDLVTAD